jgi:hypothetical protein
MKIIITESQLKKLSSKNLLLEYDILPYKQTTERGSRLDYSFNVGDIEYAVTLLGTEDKQVYELGFGVVGENESTYRTGKDVKHLNTVLYTVDAIVKEAVVKYRIKKIIFSGARGETDSKLPFIDPIRMKTYFRFLTNKYPNANFDKDHFGNIQVYMKTIYPEVFDNNKDKKEIMLDFLEVVNDDSNENDYWRWDSSFKIDQYGGLNGYTDAIANSEYGTVNLELYYDPSSYKKYDLELKFFDLDEEESESFTNFDDVMQYLKQRFNVT